MSKKNTTVIVERHPYEDCTVEVVIKMPVPQMFWHFFMSFMKYLASYVKPY
ncbi:hypothetical protein GCM10016272_09290 [Psychrobacter glaciei]|uniref:Uncharacterized protein n=1 Tax=Psychrobacter glaciei TaxID=619771 RepID=A0ABQ3GQQ4_9GAMM|nr:hypothetical protein GCM10016272_09290 [Psychrobacter glaciei]